MYLVKIEEQFIKEDSRNLQVLELDDIFGYEIIIAGILKTKFSHWL